jgi:CheY-like chemotaxis protein
MTAARPRVLLVEDEVLITLLLQDMLLDLECEIADAPASLNDALSAARTGAFDLALIDLNLHGKLTYPVADILKARQIPFIFVTGYGAAALEPAYADALVLEKPFHRKDLEAIIARVFSDPRPGEIGQRRAADPQKHSRGNR